MTGKISITLMLLLLVFSLSIGAVYSQSLEQTAPDNTMNKTQEEIDQELQQELDRIQAAYEEETLEEFIPSEPLSADVSVSFPSDI
tara:strand:- start:168 stop:425 length:258 start_codon:yes stop_codon:yes gene_type:complete